MQLRRLLANHFRSFDWLLFGAVLVVFALGLMAVVSVTIADDHIQWSIVSKQVFLAGIGIVLVLIGSIFDYRALQASSRVLYFLGVAILVAVLFFGTTIRGTRGWFVIAGFTLQPVEFVKVILLIFLAKYFSSWARDIDRIRHILFSGIGAAVLTLLTFFQPDFGSAFLLFAVWFGTLLLAGLRRRHLLVLLAILAVVGVLGWGFGLRDYQRDRILTFVRPGSDPLGRDYNITQATIAIGSGQLLGRGFGFGSQSQLRFLPEAQTDFIFAVIAEELGFVGVGVFFLAWAIIFWRCLYATRFVRDDFSAFFLTSATLLLFLEFSVTVGMNIGFLPVTGLPLPFASLGGSALLAHFAIIAIIESMIVRRGLSTVSA